MNKPSADNTTQTQTKSSLNSRQERFAQLVALGALSLTEAYRQAGYSEKGGPANALALKRNHTVASRIAALQAEAALPSGQQSLQAITRQELAELLAKVIKAGFGNPEKARVHDALKASELLTKLCGWNEPERVNVQSVEVKVDAALIEQLRAGYAELGRRQQQQLAASVAARGGANGAPSGGMELTTPPR